MKSSSFSEGPRSVAMGEFDEDINGSLFKLPNEKVSSLENDAIVNEWV